MDGGVTHMRFGKDAKIAIGMEGRWGIGRLFFTSDENMRFFDERKNRRSLWNPRDVWPIPFNIGEADIEQIKDFLCETYGFERENIIDRTRPELRVYKKETWYNQDSKIVVAQLRKFVMFTDYYSLLVFMPPENSNKIDITKVQVIPEFKTFKEARSYLIETYGFKEENVQDIDGDEEKIYEPYGLAHI